MSDDPSQLQSTISDQRSRIIDIWTDRLLDHPDSLYEQQHLDEIKSLCHQMLDACEALLGGQEQPRVHSLARKLRSKQEAWSLDTKDSLRFFWELRNAFLEFYELGSDSRATNWRGLNAEINQCIEAGIIGLVETVESGELID